MKTRILFLMATFCVSDLFCVHLAYGYRPVSPYAYCMNNPIKFVDPDGRKLVSANGTVLWNTDPDKGKVGWTKAGMQSSNLILRQHLNELQKTVTGKQQFDKLVKSDLPITIKYGNLGKGTFGETKTNVDQKSNTRKSAEITIDTENNKGKAKDNNVTHDQAIASTLGHEIRHTEDKNYEMQITTPAETPYAQSPEEIDAKKVGDQIINDYHNGNYYKANSTNFSSIFLDWLNRLFK